jgi:hypothetical protein
MEDHAIAAEQWDAAAAYRQDRRGLWQELQTLKASLPPPQGLQDKVACQAVTITVGLDKMSPQEQRRWRKKLGHSPRSTWLVQFREALCRHPQMGRHPIYIDVHTTTEDDITVQVLAYLLQAKVVLWEDIEPWVKHYATAWGQETEGKRWDTCLRRTWCEDMLAFALPQEANALRPRDITKPPGTMSLPEVAYAWGMTERQLHSLMPRLLSQQKVSRITKGRFSYIPVDDVERLQDNEDVEAARTRHTAKLQRKKTNPSVSGEETLQAGLTEFDEERLQACIEEFTTRKELATTPEEVQTIMEILEEARKQLRQRQRGSDT